MCLLEKWQTQKRHTVWLSKSSANELMACLITNKAIPTEYIKEEMILDNEKFQIGLNGNLPVIKVPPVRKSWEAVDVFDIFISKFMCKVDHCLH